MNDSVFILIWYLSIITLQFFTIACPKNLQRNAWFLSSLYLLTRLNFHLSYLLFIKQHIQSWFEVTPLTILFSKPIAIKDPWNTMPARIPLMKYFPICSAILSSLTTSWTILCACLGIFLIKIIINDDKINPDPRNSNDLSPFRTIIKEDRRNINRRQHQRDDSCTIPLG